MRVALSSCLLDRAHAVFYDVEVLTCGLFGRLDSSDIIVDYHLVFAVPAVPVRDTFRKISQTEHATTDTLGQGPASPLVRQEGMIV